jgi:hypothetical protein
MTNKPIITKKLFTYLFGRPPENDDLDRVNCSEAGKLGHRLCGICKRHRLPMFCCDDIDCIKDSFNGKAIL